MTVKKHDVPEELINSLMANYRKPEDLIGENGLLKQLTKILVEKALEAEMAEHLGGLHYVGRLAGASKPTDEGWAEEIHAAEKLLIYAHQPVHNTSNKKTIPEDQVESHHVYNWGAIRNLFPEVSGKRYTSAFANILETHIYSM